ncbi:dienelactone hydrolase family protein [Halobaculum gomorrense]|uniref:dienelactone hydrolase family protein n=1 Tax=Halobaculum gomorrense TaxID=43928 RepID=UPI0009327593|nr:dienelactone hydrolase family protein [Halobaculum gomorrense]
MTDVLVPGGRDVRGSLDRTSEAKRGAASTASDADACVVACPPHPQHRGHRGDERLRAVSSALTAGGVDCFRFDYGDWDGGYGERADARNAVAWARERYDRVGLFGFSFGGTLALLVASESGASEGDVDAVSALAPTARIASDLDAVAALEDIDCPTQVVYATRDDTADWKPVVERARELGVETVEWSADHFFVGQAGKVGDAVGAWLSDAL